MKNCFYICLLTLLITKTMATTNSVEWKLSVSEINQKVWISDVGIAVGKQKSVSKDFKIKAYLQIQKKYKAKALALLGAKDWKIENEQKQNNKIIFTGHYTDQKERTVQFIEVLDYSSEKQKLKTLLLTKTSADKKLTLKNSKKEIKKFLDAL